MEPAPLSKKTPQSGRLKKRDQPVEVKIPAVVGLKVLNDWKPQTFQSKTKSENKLNSSLRKSVNERKDFPARRGVHAAEYAPARFGSDNLPAQSISR
jgi:hypothetical protein